MKFSIVTPSFNQLDHLKRCVASVADQAGSFELEHLIHDGGSGAEFEKWSSSQDSASVVMEKDKGMSPQKCSKSSCVDDEERYLFNRRNSRESASQPQTIL
jgi:hypothetical protein